MGEASLLRGQFSVALLFAVMTVACLAMAVHYYQGDRIAGDLARIPDSRSDELVPAAAGLGSLLMGVVAAVLVYRLRSDYGMGAVWALVSLGVLAVIVAWCWDVDSLAKTQVRNLKPAQILPAVLFGLGCALPLGAFVGWYCKFVATA
jgi:hypothetical protein